jgi:hypothetical protein
MRFCHKVGLLMMPRVLRIAMLAAGLGAALPASPALAGSSVYDLKLAGVRLGEIRIDAEESGESYRAASRIVSTGLVGAFTDYGFVGEATGRLAADGSIAPERFRATSVSPRAERRTEIDWQGTTPVRVSVVPPRSREPDPARMVGALDPVSAGFALLRDNAPENICDASIEVYDGSRRSRLVLGDPVKGDGTLSCNGTYARLEGEAHSLSSQTEYPFRLVFRPRGDGLMRLDRIETETRFGRAVVARRG